MTEVKAAMRALITTSTAILLFIGAIFVTLGQTIRNTFRRKHRVSLVTDEANSPMVGASGVTIMEMIKERCPSLYGPQAFFKPVWWIIGGNMQTIWCVVGEIFGRYEIPYERSFIRTPDGGTISLDVYPPFESHEDDTPILFILHGLTGNTQESYVRDTVKEVTRSKVETGKGFRCVAMNFRGCDVDSPVTSPRLYHAGETDDTRTALLWLSHTYPKAALYGAGYSMGACTIACYLGEEGEKTPLKGVVCVSNPWNWTIATPYIEEGTWLGKYIYGPILADALLTMFKNSRYAFEQDKRISMKEIYSRRYVTIRWFDDRVTAPCFGFEDGWDYYKQASSQQYIDKIRVPHLSIHSRDDPMVAPWNLPYDDVKKNGNVVMATTQGGGHVAWFTWNKRKELTRWYATPIREFVEAIQAIDPTPRPAPPALEADMKGLVRSAELPDRVGFREIDAEGLMTARIYSATAHNPVLGS